MVEGVLSVDLCTVGTVLCAMQGILVDRKDPDSRKKAVEAINEHANKSESTFLPTLDTSVCTT